MSTLDDGERGRAGRAATIPAAMLWAARGGIALAVLAPCAVAAGTVITIHRPFLAAVAAAMGFYALAPAAMARTLFSSRPAEGWRGQRVAGLLSVIGAGLGIAAAVVVFLGAILEEICGIDACAYDRSTVVPPVFAFSLRLALWAALELATAGALYWVASFDAIRARGGAVDVDRPPAGDGAIDNGRFGLATPNISGTATPYISGTAPSPSRAFRGPFDRPSAALLAAALAEFAGARSLCSAITAGLSRLRRRRGRPGSPSPPLFSSTAHLPRSRGAQSGPRARPSRGSSSVSPRCSPPLA